MKKFYFISILSFGVFIVLLFSPCMAENVEIILDSNNGSSGLEIQNLSTTTVATLDSQGNIKTSGTIETKGGVNFFDDTTQTTAGVAKTGDSMTGHLTLEAGAIFYGDGSGLTDLTATDNTKVLKSGDTMTGNLTLSSGADLNVSGLIDTTDGIRFSDDSIQTTAASSTPLPEATTNGQTLRYDGSNWVASSLVYNDDTNVGIGTASPTTSLEVNNGMVAFTGPALPWDGQVPQDFTVPLQGEGTRFMWIPQLAAIRAGYVDGTQWDQVLYFNPYNIGTYSVAMGKNTTAKGVGSVAMGFNTTASTYYSVAFGYNSYAQGASAFAAGFNTKAKGRYSFSMGESALAEGESSFALGSYTNSKGYYSVATGLLTTTESDASFTIGSNFVNPYSHSLGIGHNDLDTLISSEGNSWLNLTEGNVGIGTNEPQRKLDINGTMRLRNLVVGTGTAFYRNSTTGDLVDASSSLRYKKDIKNYSFDTNKIEQLRPVRFKWNENTVSNNEEDFGLIAEEVNKLFPELVVLKNGQPEALKYDKISVVLLKVVQEQHKKIKDLEDRLSKLENKN